MRHSLLLAAAALGAVTAPLASQTPTGGAAPGVEISGLMFGSFSVRTDSAARASLGGKRPSAFSIDRIYVNFKAPAGDNGAFRLTTDIFQNTNPGTNGYYQGWTVRLKYAWFEYTALRDAFGAGSSLSARVGSINNVVIDPVQGVWPRYFSPIAVERVPYFSSADVGVGALLTLPRRMGDVYATITNGSGYASFDRDRFKDPAIRVALTPFGNESGYLRSLTLMPWYYRGMVGSQFASGGAGQVGPGTNGAVTDALTRDRYGLNLALRDRRLTWSAEIAYNRDQSESGANTLASPRVVADSTGRLIDGFVVVRPLEFMDPSRRSALSLIARYDHFTPNVSPSAANYAGTTPSYDYTVLGAAYDLNQRITLAVDWQLDRPTGYPPPTGTNLLAPRPRMSTLFAHFNATF